MQPFLSVLPEEVGISSRDILALLDSYVTGIPEEETHSVVLLRPGQLVASGAYAPYSLKDRNTVFSVSKMYVSTAIGFCVSEGHFGLDDFVAELLPEYATGEISPRVRRIRVRHLLSMTSGQEGEVVHEGRKTKVSDEEADWAREFFQRECDVEPGTEFRYDGFCTYLLSVLLKKYTGMDLLDYLKPRLFDPLEMPVPPCIRDKNGLPIGWTGLRVTIGELCRMGQLYLDGGKYQGKQILPLGWVEEASRCHIPTGNHPVGADWSEGYSFQFWRSRDNAYRFCGALGQMCLIAPEKDLVFCVFSGYNNDRIHKELEKFYDLVYFKISDAPLPPDPEGNAMLRDFVSRMAIPEAYATPSPAIPLLEGRTLPLAPGTPFRDVSFSFVANAVTVTLGGDAPVTFAAGFTSPMRTPVESKGTVVLRTDFDTEYSSTARFTAPRRLTVTTHIIACPTDLILEADFEKGEATLRAVRGAF